MEPFLISLIIAATPVLFAGLGELVTERAGVLNLGVEGMMLMGAVAAFAEQPPDGRRGLRYVYLEAGALLQNICLQATALGLGTVFVGGFDDAKTASVLNLPSPFEPVGMICVGWPAA